MTALIIGGDYVEPLKREIQARGHECVQHWAGRKAGFAKRSIPESTRLVVILCDYVSHNLSSALKQQANRIGVPLVFCRRSANDLRRKLDHMAASDDTPCRRNAAFADAVNVTGTPKLSGFRQLNA